MKIYTVPQIVANGSVVEATKTGVEGKGDPFDRVHLILAMPGSVGFQL